MLNKVFFFCYFPILSTFLFQMLLENRCRFKQLTFFSILTTYYVLYSKLFNKKNINMYIFFYLYLYNEHFKNLKIQYIEKKSKY